MDGSIINQILSECETWERAPINEILGYQDVNYFQKVKRIIVYGSTQMGKTTMIMNLIGIKEDKKKELSQMLRGEAKEGNSSTSTPIVYSRWNSDKFGIAIGTETGETEGTLREYLKDEFVKEISKINDTQRHLSGKEANMDTVRYYYIPSDFFKKQDAEGEVQILDLPGFGEKNSQMYDMVDALYEKASSFASGAIAVIKAEKITNLQSEYKLFLDGKHVNHLALAVTYAISTNSEIMYQLKSRTGYFEGCITGEDFANSITSYYYQNMIDAEYISKSKFPDSKAIFPLEPAWWVCKEFPNVPELEEAFEIISQRLINRVDIMNNTTSVEMCIEKLCEKEEKLKDIIEKLGEEKRKYKKNINEKNALLEKNSKIILEQYERRKEMDQKIKKYDEEYISVARNINAFDSSSYSPSNKCFKKGLLWSAQTKELMTDLFNHFKKIIPTNYDLCSGFEQKIRGVIATSDYSEVIKARIPRNCQKSVLYLCSSVAMTLCGSKNSFSNVHREGQLIIMLKQNLEKVQKPLFHEIEEIERKIHSLNEVERLCRKTIEENQRELSLTEQKITYYTEKIKKVQDTQKRVKEIFIKHFLLKERELLERIDRETNPDIEMALFIAYSAIFLSIKPYMEDFDE